MRDEYLIKELVVLGLSVISTDRDSTVGSRSVKKEDKVGSVSVKRHYGFEYARAFGNDY